MAKEPEPEPVLYETSVFLVVQGIGGIEVPALVSNDSAFLSITDVFDFLKIRNMLSPSLDSVQGFFITEQAAYVIDKANHQINYQGKIFPLMPTELIGTETGLYMSTSSFGKVFGLNCKFNFRSLSVTMTTKVELPAIREMRQEVMRRNIGRLKGQLKADTVIGLNRSLFQFGMADWSIVATQRNPGANDTWLNLTLGGTVAGGETTVSLNYNNYAQQQLPYSHDTSAIRAFDQRRQYYRWRYVNNDNRALRQVTVGKIFTQSTASIFSPVVGVQFTNTPTSYRRSFGSYTLSNFTEPGWTVELYVNNALVDYAVADASGFFTFQVPLVYGNSIVRLRFFGPWGEERFREENMSVPFNFLPLHEFEYTASAGIVEDGRNSLFSRVEMNYGATRYITMGAGVEYLSSITTTDKTMPFVNASARLFRNLLLSGDYTYGVRGRGIMSYRLPSNLQFELYYTRYKKGQKAIIYNYKEERKAVISKPFMSRRFSMFTRFTFNQIVLPDTKYTTTELLLSGSIFRVGTSFSTYGIFISGASPFIYSNLALTYRMPGEILINPQLQYEYNTGRPISVRCELGKYLFRHGYVNVSYEQNFKSRFTNIGIGLRYDFNFTQVGASAWHGTQQSMLVESARGSLVHDGKTGYTGFNNRSSVGTGGVVLIPFLDFNGNDRRDPGEPKAAGLKVNINGGRVLQNRDDTTVRIMNMEPYEHYFIELNKNSFDNIAWRLKKPTISVIIDPNQLKSVEVPVAIMGEVSGTVILQENDSEKGLGRITVCFYRPDSTLAAKVQTESDGFFNFLGLTPGAYTARIDPAQLQKLGMMSTPEAIPFKVSLRLDGDVIDDLQFRIKKESNETPPTLPLTQ
ncbi:hypothetical protein [Chitinophaga sp. MM2321]|uniref:hypothetical protein n=1 Tax=Chitinophaga sp. MM2321 TaxID=3137178 RepID=UPI0032D5A6BF